MSGPLGNVRGPPPKEIFVMELLHKVKQQQLSEFEK
jgi:hypothetical protein